MARILISDDSDFMRETIKGILSEAKHEILGEAKNGDEAIEKFTLLKPDLVTMDILMRPGGIKAIKKIREMDPKASILVISVLEDSQADIVEAIRLGANGYVGKPIKKEVLISEVKRVLNKRS
ncbi:MAG: response regulator [Candidatus Omnitrophota bacterium]|nr:response regulator [Candidatus Omnitrophota bacterium]